MAGVSRATVSAGRQRLPKVSPDVRRTVEARDRPPGLRPQPRPPGASSPAAATRSRWSSPSRPAACSSDPFFPRLVRGISAELAAATSSSSCSCPRTGRRERGPSATSRRPRRRRRPGQPPRRRPPARRTCARAASRWSSSAGRRAAEVELRRRRQPRRRPAPSRHLSSAAAGASPPSPARRTWRRRRPARRLPRRAHASRPRATTDARRPGDFTHEGGAAAMQRLLGPPDLDAVFAASDLMAAGALASSAPPAGASRTTSRSSASTTRRSPSTPTAAHQRPAADRGDGPRDGPPARRGRSTRTTGPRRVILATELIQRASSAGRRRPEPAGDRRASIGRRRPNTCHARGGDRSGDLTEEDERDAPSPDRWRVIALLGVIASSPRRAHQRRRASAAPRERPAPPAPTPPTPTPLVTPEPIDAGVPAPTAASSSAGSSAGRGGQPQQIAAQTGVRRRLQQPPEKDKVYISLEIYDNKVAANILKTQIAAGNAPDIIGPVGVEGLNLFRDQLLDLEPLIELDRVRHEQVPRRSPTSSRSARAAPRSASRSRPTRRSSGTTRTCSTRPSCRTRRPRSATSTTASRGTWPPSASWA